MIPMGSTVRLRDDPQRHTRRGKVIALGVPGGRGSNLDDDTWTTILWEDDTFGTFPSSWLIAVAPPGFEFRVEAALRERRGGKTPTEPFRFVLEAIAGRHGLIVGAHFWMPVLLVALGFSAVGLMLVWIEGAA